MTVLPKLSSVLLAIARSAFVDPEALPSSEAAHAALLFAQVAWNRSLGHETEGYRSILKVFVSANPALWSELRSRDPEVLIETMLQIKERRHAADVRVVLVSGIRDGNVHVEWCDEKDFPQASRQATERFQAKYGPCAIVENPGSHTGPIQREKIGRNDPCPCGSGAKYKKCCGK